MNAGLGPVKKITRSVNTLAADTPELAVSSAMEGRSGLVIHNRSTSAANVLVLVVNKGATGIDNTYMQSTGNVDCELAPGSSEDFGVDAGMEVYVCAVGSTATIAIGEYIAQ